ncbi:hypothetical protein [Treponema denticola]|uniref:hypothetical protein n=1 Tax=Treponema denticola TaxID=158 RepID=UPI002107A48E|nr:hypothetical protein [Treponema denticola]
MENWRNSYYLRDLDNPTIGNGNNGSNIPNTKTGRASNSHTISNPIEPNPVTHPVRPRIPANTDTNPIEPNPSTPPVRVEKPVNTDTNPIEPNPVTHPVRVEKPDDSDTNPIEPNPGTPPVRVEKQVNTGTNPIEPNPVTHPVRVEKPVNTDTNPIEPNPVTHPVRPEKPDDSDTNPIEPNPGTPPVRDEKLTATGSNLIGPNPSNSTNDGTKIGNSFGIKLADDSSTKGIDKNDEVKSAANTGNSALQKNAAEINHRHTEHVEVSPKTKARDLLLSKRGSTDNAALAEFSHTSRRDILEFRRNKPASIIVDYDTQGRDVTLDDFNVDGMDISIKREHDGYGNKFDSVRTIETVKLANGQVVKCNIQDMVGANAESKAFADKHKGMTLPDGKYYFTADKLEKQADGTYNSACFQNTLRLQTKDSNIPKNIRDDINSKYFLFHATEYKEGYIPKNGGNRIWINPWSAGCISSITGGQSTHDDFMNMLTGITPENINVTITSKRHVDI